MLLLQVELPGKKKKFILPQTLVFPLRLEEGRGENHPPFLTKAKTTGNMIYLKLTVLQGMLDWLMVSDIILVSFSAVVCREESNWKEFCWFWGFQGSQYYLSWEQGHKISSPLGSQNFEQYWRQAVWTGFKRESESFGIQYDDRCHPADTYKLQCKPFSGLRQESLIPKALVWLRLVRLPDKYQYWELQWKDIQQSGKLGFPTAQQPGWQEARHAKTCLTDRVSPGVGWNTLGTIYRFWWTSIFDRQMSLENSQWTVISSSLRWFRCCLV